MSPIARRRWPRIGVHRSPDVDFVQPPWAVLEEACFSIRCQHCRPLAEATTLRFPTFETGFGRSFFSSRIPEPQKSCSTSSIHRSQLASLSAPYRSGFGLSLASMQQVSNQRHLDLGLADWYVPERVLFARAKALPLLVGVLAEAIGAVPPSGGRPLTEIWIARVPDRDIAFIKRPAYQGIDRRTFPPPNGQQVTRPRSPINSVCQMVQRTRGLRANSRLESDNLRHPFDHELCQFRDDQSPLSVWVSWQQDG